MTKKIEKKTGKGKNGTNNKNVARRPLKGGMPTHNTKGIEMVASVVGLPTGQTISITLPPILMARLMLVAAYDEVLPEKLLVDIIASECAALERYVDNDAIKEARNNRKSFSDSEVLKDACNAYCNLVKGLIPARSVLRRIPLVEWDEMRKEQIENGSEYW